MRPFARLAAWTQAAYFASTALWALLDVPAFMRVTGPKTDVWLVETVAVLILVIAAVLASAAWRRAISPEVALLGSLSALGLACVDVIYVSTGTISPVYLLDAIPELALVVLWGAASRAPRPARHARRAAAPR